jgi:ketosteroid isomerase-like protein
MDVKSIASSFVEAINSQDLDRLSALMTDNHVFIDSDGKEYSGGENMRRGWESYFSMVPDYRIEVAEVLSEGDTAVLLGSAEGTFVRDGEIEPENHWSVPAAWRAVVKDHRVTVWQLYVNPEPMQAILKRLGAS